ncbi:hypothetical protein FB567DRAFT_625504 [Paraphoma chrysanthemicola]|uniref:AB hydrolase-1 domain-containing protein n=1 Tax=Paraphoma chrysanthemicola TaxID=798071 RepID=A0A8K0W2H6_9PLEO|nr:hypothetical protein FB567DRAFT_625504 [Paraphoma chrysanthemicola]
MAHDDTEPTGLTFWSKQATTETPYNVDIIAVQGLGAHPFYTWVKKVAAPVTQEKRASKNLGRLFGKKNKTQVNHEEGETQIVMWPRDLLVPTFSSARVATYSYGSDWRDKHVNTSLRECGQQLLEVLLQHRQGDDERRRPLVFIGHSLGGLVVQQALAIAVHGSSYTDLRLSVAGIVFLGSPFQGSDEAAYAQWLAKLVRLQEEEGHKYTLLKTLQKESRELHNLSIDFWRSYGEYDMACFYENREAAYGPLSRQFVGTQSATLVGKKLVYMDADHSGLNKFSGRQDKNFILLLPELQRMVQNSDAIVKDRYRPHNADPTGNIHWIVPRTVNSLFTGRTELIDRIKRALHDDGGHTTVQKRLVLTGIGGIGKSEVCLTLADAMREDFWGIFWVDVASQATAKNDFLAVAKALGSPAESINESLSALAITKKRWLLILDNADDPRLDYKQYIPSGVAGVVIMTSRIPQCSQYSTVPAEALEGLDDEHSTQLLLKAAHVPEEQWQSCGKHAQKIVQLLGSHTLALIQAGAYIAEGYCQLDEYPERYERQRKRLLEHYPDQQQSRYRDVYATFEASADVLNSNKAGQDALDLLAILGMLHSSILPLQVFADAWRRAARVSKRSSKLNELGSLGQWHVSQLPAFSAPQAYEWDDFRLKKATALLATLSLVTRHRQDKLDGLSMHPLAHAWARDRLQTQQRKQAWLSTGCVLAMSQRQLDTWQVYERELRPHLQSFLAPRVEQMFSYTSHDAILAILLRCGWALDKMRDDDRLEVLLAGIYRELQINPEDPSEAHVKIWDLAARNLKHMGHIKGAVVLLEYAMKVRETLAETHPERLRSQHVLAGAYKSDGQTMEAIALLEHIVKVGETTLAETHPNQLASQHELAKAYRANGQKKEAIALLEHVVKVEETTLAETHPDRLVSQHALARAYKANGQTKEAVVLLEHVVKVEETTLAETHPDRLSSQHALALAYDANGQTADAIVLLESVVAVKSRVFSDNHPSRLISIKALRDMRARLAAA